MSMELDRGIVERMFERSLGGFQDGANGRYLRALISIGHALSIENAEQFHSAEYAEEKIITAIRELRREYLVALDRAMYAEAELNGVD